MNTTNDFVINTNTVGMSFNAFEKDGLWGVKNEETGEIICEPEFDSIDKFYSGFAVICKKGRRGFINSEGKKVFQKYCDVRRFVNGLAAVKLFFDRWTFIDVAGNELTKQTYKEVGDFNTFSYAAVCEEDKKCGFINRAGIEILDGCVFDETEVRSNGTLVGKIEGVEFVIS